MGLRSLPQLFGAASESGSVISTDGIDGLHLTAESERKLGIAIAAKVKEMLK
jgi:hypothetical protein